MSRDRFRHRVPGRKKTVRHKSVRRCLFKSRHLSNVCSLAPWVDNLALMTVQRIIHLLHPNTHLWSFSLADEGDIDRKIFQYYMWSIPGHVMDALEEDHKKPIQYSSVVVAFQPPWILSLQDIKEFAKCRSVRLYHNFGVFEFNFFFQFPPFREPGHAVRIFIDKNVRNKQ